MRSRAHAVNARDQTIARFGAMLIAAVFARPFGAPNSTGGREDQRAQVVVWAVLSVAGETLMVQSESTECAPQAHGALIRSHDQLMAQSVRATIRRACNNSCRPKWPTRPFALDHFVFVSGDCRRSPYASAAAGALECALPWRRRCSFLLSRWPSIRLNCRLFSMLFHCVVESCVCV